MTLQTPPKAIIAEIIDRIPGVDRPAHNMLAHEIIKKLDAAGYVIAPKAPDIRMMQAGVIAWRAKHDAQVYAEPLAEACYLAMLECAGRSDGETADSTEVKR
jgi:hypothetical protein